MSVCMRRKRDSYIHKNTYQKYVYRRKLTKNQSVETAGVAFVKGANKRNEFFEKINKQ